MNGVSHIPKTILGKGLKIVALLYNKDLTNRVTYVTFCSMNGPEVKELRKKLNLTQKELADKIGVARLTIVRWEKEQKKPSRLARRQLARLAK